MTSPVINFEAVCDALASRFAAATIGTPTGAAAMRASYSETPKNVPAVPAHLLEVQTGTVTANPGQWKHEMDIDGVFLLSKRPGDTARVETQRRLWLPYLLHAAVDQMKLGYGGATGYSVDKVVPTSWEFTEFVVASDEYDAIRVSWRLYITENVTPTP
ncbi:MAG: hypothetical protein ACO3HN_06355 [Opitutales bacterium]